MDDGVGRDLLDLASKVRCKEGQGQHCCAPQPADFEEGGGADEEHGGKNVVLGCERRQADYERADSQGCGHAKQELLL